MIVLFYKYPMNLTVEICFCPECPKDRQLSVHNSIIIIQVWATCWTKWWLYVPFYMAKLTGILSILGSLLCTADPGYLSNNAYVAYTRVDGFSDWLRVGIYQTLNKDYYYWYTRHPWNGHGIESLRFFVKPKTGGESLCKWGI